MKNVVVHLSKDLVSKYGLKRFPVRKGDLVRIVRGDSEKEEKINIVGKEGKVIKVITNKGKVIIENINVAKADGKMKPRKIDPSAIVITKLLTEDKKRKERLTRLASLRNKVIEEEPEPEVTEPEETEKKEEPEEQVEEEVVPQEEAEEEETGEEEEKEDE